MALPKPGVAGFSNPTVTTIAAAPASPVAASPSPTPSTPTSGTIRPLVGFFLFFFDFIYQQM